MHYLNFSVAPYYYREHQKSLNPLDNIDGFDSNQPIANNNKTSFTDFAQYSDIIAFDFYPYRANGQISNNVVINYNGSVLTFETSVGEFTKLLKKKYPSKPIWPVIQTSWFEPMDPVNIPSPKIIINDKIIRHLTFDAIINGADGLSFWGHQRGLAIAKQKNPQNPYATPFEYLDVTKNGIWKNVLYQTNELKYLQESLYDNILLEDNLPNSFVKNNNVEYCFKKSSTSNKYYLFITNFADHEITTSIKIPKGLKIVQNTLLQSVGIYTMPALDNPLTPQSDKDYRNLKAIGSVARNGTSFYTTLDKYGTNIISMQLESSNRQDDIATFYKNTESGGSLVPVPAAVHLTLSNVNGSSSTYMNWANNNNGWNSASIMKAVSGDFNNDGNKDIGVFYKYGTNGAFNPVNVHLITSDNGGNSKTIMDWADYSNNNIITDWNSASIIESVSGDFNNDGNDDIAVFYRYGGNGGPHDPVRVHLITSDGKGNSKTIMHWATNNDGWNSNSIIKAVSGDFNNDGNDDIAVFYKYGSNGAFNPVNVHLITSDGKGNRKLLWIGPIIVTVILLLIGIQQV